MINVFRKLALLVALLAWAVLGLGAGDAWAGCGWHGCCTPCCPPCCCVCCPPCCCCYCGCCCCVVTPYPYPYPPIHPKLPGVMGGGVSQNVGPVNAGQTYGSTASPAESGYLPGTILATVPADAKVFLNGHLTQSTGTQRRYICAEMLPGRFYKYVVRVEYVQDNQTVQRSHELIVGAGQTKTLDLDTVGEDVTKIAVSP